MHRFTVFEQIIQMDSLITCLKVENNREFHIKNLLIIYYSLLKIHNKKTKFKN